MLFFKGMIFVMKRKICEHSVFPESRKDLIALVKKLHPSVESENTIKSANSDSTVSVNVNPTFKCKN